MNKERKELAELYRIQALRKLTFHEKYFRKYLTKLKYVQQKNFFYTSYRFYRVDFYIPSHRLVIEIDGPLHEKNKEYDRVRTKNLLSLGIKKVLRFKNIDIFDRKTVIHTLRLALHETKPRKYVRKKKKVTLLQKKKKK